MTDTTKAPKALPTTLAEADVVIRKSVIIFTSIVSFLLFSATLFIPVLNWLVFRLLPTSPPAIIIDLISLAVVMGVFIYGSGRLADTLISFGRNFVALGRWQDAESVLSSLNTWGQNFLDKTGEGHYLLSVALMRRGKYETARKAKDFVLKSRANTEWARKVEADDKALAVPTPSARAEEKSIKPSKAKRRRF